MKCASLEQQIDLFKKEWRKYTVKCSGIQNGIKNHIYESIYYTRCVRNRCVNFNTFHFCFFTFVIVKLSFFICIAYNTEISRVVVTPVLRENKKETICRRNFPESRIKIERFRKTPARTFSARCSFYSSFDRLTRPIEFGAVQSLASYGGSPDDWKIIYTVQTV